MDDGTSHYRESRWMSNKIWFKFPERVSLKTLVLRTPCFGSLYPQVVRAPPVKNHWCSVSVGTWETIECWQWKRTFNIFVMLTYVVWGLDHKMFTKLRFQSRSKKFWNCWLIKQYTIIVRSRLINTHIRIHYHFSTFSEYWERSTWQFGTNVINQKFWCVSHLFTKWSL